MWKMAWRNLWRNRTRTLITATAIGFVYAIYLISTGVQEWSFQEMRAAASKAAGGDVLVQPVGFADEPGNGLVLAKGDALIEELGMAPGVRVVAPRVHVEGMLSTSASTVPVTVRGVDPDTEPKIHDISAYLSDGTWFEAELESPLVLGKVLVDELDVEIGDRVILTANDVNGEMGRHLFHLAGIVSTGSRASDYGIAIARVEDARRALGIDEGFTQIGLVGGDRFALADGVRGAIADDRVEVLPWDQAMPELVGFIEMKKGGGAMMGVLLFFVVLFSIVNTFMMVVMERVREFGLLGALGLTPWQSAKVLLIESTLLAFVSMAIGLGVALALHGYISVAGIDIAALSGDSASMDVAGVSLTDTVIRSAIDPASWIGASISVLVMVLVAALYPAWKASRLVPAEAMRFYE